MSDRARLAPASRERRSHAERTAETRARIMDAVVESIAEVGFQRTTATEIARRRGIGTRTVIIVNTSIAGAYARLHDIPLETDLVIAHHIHDGILDAARRHRADLLVMGWKGYTNTRERMFGEVADQVIRHAPSDLLLLKLEKGAELKRVLFPTAGGPNARLAAEMLGALEESLELELTACYVVPPGASSEEMTDAELRVDQAIFRLGGVADAQIIQSKSIAGGIAKASRDYDLVVLGAAREPLFQRVLFGEIPEKVARYSPASVMVVKRYEGAVKSLLKRALG